MSRSSHKKTGYNPKQGKEKRAEVKSEPQAERPKCGFCRKTNRKSTHHEEQCWRKEGYLEGKRDTATESAALIKSEPSTYNNHDYAFFAYAESGASSHMTDQIKLLMSLKFIQRCERVASGVGDRSLEVLGIGDAKVRTWSDGVWIKVTMKNVLYVPLLRSEVPSIGAATDQGLQANFHPEGLRRAGLQERRQDRRGRSMHH
jgi:hypothetical protein